MSYKLSQIDKKNFAWFKSDNTCNTLVNLEVSNGKIRGITPVNLSFQYPITAIVGENGSGKSTILALVTCAFHNFGSFCPHNRTRIGTKQTRNYYTYGDFFTFSPQEEGIKSIEIKARYLSGDGAKEDKRRKKPSGKWNDYNTRPSRAVTFLGINRILPPSESGPHRHYCKNFNRFQLSDQDINQLKLSMGKILAWSYDDIELLEYNSYRLFEAKRNNIVYTGFNMGAGENAVLSLLLEIVSAGRGALIVIDEIELGTDSDEAASLYKVLLEHLSHKHCRIVLTTHHKNLAALMANREDVGLIAALYDEGKRRPRYEFLQGSIGKSYAFETAQNYGIPASLVSRAKEVYGEEKLHLNELIERSSTLELELKQKLRTLEQKEQAYERKTNALNEAIARAQSEYVRTKAELERTYHNALNELKKHMKENDNKNIHRGINAANAMLKAHARAQSDKSDTRPSKPHELKKGDYAKYGQSRGMVVEIMGKMCVLELDNGVRLKLPLHQLKPAQKPPQARKIEATPKPSVPVNVSLDLHGKRVEEALEELGNFLSNALIAGFDEVLVYHGIGTGRLSAAVAEFLKSHPKVRAFEDAPMNLGGFGAKVVRL